MAGHSSACRLRASTCQPTMRCSPARCRRTALWLSRSSAAHSCRQGWAGRQGCALWPSIESRMEQNHVDALAIRLHPGQQGAVPLPGTAADTHPVPTRLPSRAHLHRFRLTGLWTARFGYIVPVPVSLRSSQSSVMQTAASVLEAAPATSSLAPPCWHAVQPAAPHLLSCGTGSQSAVRHRAGEALHQASVCGQEHPETTAATG